MNDKSKKTLELDMDWIAATLWVLVFLTLLVYGAFAVWRFTQGVFYSSTRAPSWDTYFLAVFGVFLLLDLKNRRLRTLLGLVVLGPIARIALYWLGGLAAQRAFAPGLALIDLAVVALGLVLLVSWFRERAKLA